MKNLELPEKQKIYFIELTYFNELDAYNKADYLIWKWDISNNRIYYGTKLNLRWMEYHLTKPEVVSRQAIEREFPSEIYKRMEESELALIL